MERLPRISRRPLLGTLAAGLGSAQNFKKILNNLTNPQVLPVRDPTLTRETGPYFHDDNFFLGLIGFIELKPGSPRLLTIPIVADLATGKRTALEVPEKPFWDVSGISISPDQTKAAILTLTRQHNIPNPDDNFQPSVYVIDLTNGQAKKIDSDPEITAMYPELLWVGNTLLIITGFPAPYLPGPRSTSVYNLETETRDILEGYDGALGSTDDKNLLLINSRRGIVAVVKIDQNQQAQAEIIQTDSGDNQKVQLLDDNQTIAFTRGNSLVKYNIVTKQEQVLNGLGSLRGMTKDGKFVVLNSDQSQQDGKPLIIHNLETGREVFTQPFPQIPFLGTIEAEPGEPLRFVVWDGTIGIYSVDSSTGKTVDIKTFKPGKGKNMLLADPYLLNNEWILFYSIDETGSDAHDKLNTDLVLGSGKTGQVFATGIRRFILEGSEGYADFFFFDVLPNNSSAKTENGNYSFLSDGKKYPISSLAPEETAGILSQGRKIQTLPERSLNGIPESEEKFGFVFGDIVLDDDGQPWLLRNNVRYHIQDLENYKQVTHFNRGIFQVPSKWLVKIPIGHTEKEKSGKDGFIDWNGDYVQYSPNGNIKIMLISGYDTDSQKQKETFSNIVQQAVNAGISPNDFLESTIHIFLGPDGKITPRNFSQTDTKREPPENVNNLVALLDYYQQHDPLLELILIGHSQGGYEAIYATLQRPYMVKLVASIDSPLTGIDGSILRVSINNIGEWLVKKIGEKPAKFYTQIGKDPNTAHSLNQKIRLAQARGTKIVTSGAVTDELITVPYSIMSTSDTTVGNIPIQLAWNYGIFPDLSRGPADIYARHGEILDNPAFINQLIKMLLYFKT